MTNTGTSDTGDRPARPPHGGGAGPFGALRSWAAVLSVCAALLMPVAARAQPSAAPEYNVKAGFLVAFIQYTTWPQPALSAPDAPVVIGVLGDDPFGSVLDLTARRQRGGHPIEVRRIRTPAEAQGCHLVFISRSDAENEPDWLAAFAGQPVLTVGESGQSIACGAVIEFKQEGGRVRFDVSWPAMERAGVRFSSQMLAHASTVHQKKEAQP